MLYEKYEKKVKRHLHLLKQIYKYRYFILAITAVILSFSTYYSVSKGTIYDVSVPTSVSYGDLIKLESSAMFSDTSYEYRLKNTTEWSSITPRRAGDYEVKISSKKLFGEASKIYEFTIIPKVITLEYESNLVMFGDDPVVSSSLEYGDYIDYGLFNYEDLSLSETLATLIDLSIKDINGIDVTDSYQFDYISASVTFIPRVLEITLEDATKVYDGLPLMSDLYAITAGSLASGNTLEITTTASITEVGFISNVITDIEIYSGSNNVTINYDISLLSGFLSVSQKPITLRTDDITKVYDGEPLTSNAFSITTGSLVGTHTIELSTSGTQTSVGVSNNPIDSITILDGTNPVTSNYNITFLAGNLEITPLEIEIETSSLTKTYDGLALSSPSFSLISGILVSGDTLDIGNVTSITNAISTDNVLEIKVLNSEGIAHTSDYHIVYHYGSLTIEKRDLIIETSDLTKTYDGDPLSSIGYTLSAGELVLGESIFLIDYTEITDAGVIPNTLDLGITTSNQTNVTANYAITYQLGTLTVNPLSITIRPQDVSRVYNGSPFTSTLYTIVSGTLVFDEIVFITTSGTITDVGSSLNEILDVIVMDGSKNATSNYEFIKETGNLMITARPITVSPADQTKVYDDTQLTTNDYEIDSGSLVLDHEIIITTTGSIIDVGHVDNIITDAHIYSGLIDKTSNYEITYAIGSLDITARLVTIKTEDLTVTYDDTLHELLTYSVTSGSVIAHHFTEITSSPNATDVSSTPNALVVDIYDINHISKTSNYEITYDYGTITINPRAITLSPKLETKMYDGVPLSTTEYVILSGSLVETHVLEITTSGIILDFGVVTNDILSATITRGATPVTPNYLITFRSSTLEITARPLTIETASYTWIYNGLTLSNRDYSIIYGEIVAGDEFYIIDSATIKIVGTTPNTFNAAMIRMNSNISFNYDITYINGTLTVDFREITVLTGTTSKVYDGVELFNLDLSVISGSLADNQTFLITGYGSITDVNKVENTVIFDIVNSEDGLTTKNYIITKESGYLEITQRSITVKPANVEKIYDGTPLQNSTLMQVTEGTLVTNQDIIVSTSGRITDVGEVTNSIQIIHIMAGTNYVTSNYDITLLEGSLKVLVRPVSVSPENASKTYDDTPLVPTNYKVAVGLGFVSGHTVNVTYSGTITDAGETTSAITSIHVYNGVVEVTSNYQITLNTGLLTINTRKITITVDSISKIYDGTPLEGDSYSVSSGSLVSTHSLVVLTRPNITNVGSIQNNITFDIVNSTNESKYANYNVTYIYGFLNISYRELTIETGENFKIYDGTSLSEVSLTVSSPFIANSETINIISYTEVIHAGIYDNVIVYDIVDALGVSTKTNYHILNIYGKLTVGRRTVTISSDTHEKVYDGILLKDATYHISNGDITAYDEVVVLSSTEIINVADLENTLNYEIRNLDGVNVTTDYLITHNFGRLKITERPLTILTDSNSKEYDGTPLTDTLYTLTGSLAANESIVILNSASITYVGSISNTFEIDIVNQNLESTISNYDIQYINGTLSITYRSVSLRTPSSTKIYDGLVLFNIDINAFSGSIAGTDHIEVSDYASILHVGSITNTMTIDIVDALGNSVIDNYFYSISYGTLSITQRTITLETASDSKEYDGTPLQNQTYTIGGLGLAITDRVDVFSSSSIINVGSTDNLFEYNIVNEQFETVSSDYLVTQTTNGTLTIDPRVITIQTGTLTVTYDGLPHYSTDTSVTSGTLVENHSISVLSYNTITAPGALENILSIAILDAYSTDQTNNYDITFDYGTITVNKVNLTVKTASDSKNYDGLALTNSNYILYGVVPSIHTLTITVTGTITEVGLVFNDFTYTIVDAYGTDRSDYYVVAEDLGILEIIRVKTLIVIESASDSKEYDGLPLTNPSWEKLEGTLLAGHTLTVDVTGEITEVGFVQNGFTYQILDEFNNDVTFIYYDIQAVYGNLIVLDSNANGDTTDTGFNIDSSGDPNATGDNTYGAPIFKILTDINDTIYFRENSYGDYNKTGFNAATHYVSTFGYSPLSFTNLALNGSITTHTLSVQIYSTGLPYYTPYYMANGYNGNTDDVSISYPYSVGYQVSYTPLSSVDYNLYQVGSTYTSDELAYRNFVYNTYLTLPLDTKASMLNLASLNGLNPSNPTIITDVQNYIKNAATYNLAFSPFPTGVDYAVYFLETLQEGICQHFAMAATTMYRALGIPARYTIGIVGYSEANTWTDVYLPGHAWVEIYIDGFGWVPIEVTPGGNAGGSGSTVPSGTDTGLGDGIVLSGCTGAICDNLPLIDITSSDDSKTYDGTPLTNSVYTHTGTLNAGDYLDVNVNGTITQVGITRNTFDVVIRNSSGTDVSNLYRIRSNYGILEVVAQNNKEIMEIALFDYKKTYANTEFFASPLGYYIKTANLPSGYHVELEVNGSITYVGKVETFITSAHILDSNNIDVTSNYNLVLFTGSIEVIPKVITVTSGSKTFIYDSTSHSYNYAYSSTLAPGDTLTYVITTTITEIGTTPNRITSVKILNALGVDVTKNYSITTKNGTLSVIAE